MSGRLMELSCCLQPFRAFLCDRTDTSCVWIYISGPLLWTNNGFEFLPIEHNLFDWICEVAALWRWLCNNYLYDVFRNVLFCVRHLNKHML